MGIYIGGGRFGHLHHRLWPVLNERTIERRRWTGALHVIIYGRCRLYGAPWMRSGHLHIRSATTMTMDINRVFQCWPAEFFKMYPLDRLETYWCLFRMRMQCYVMLQQSILKIVVSSQISMIVFTIIPIIFEYNFKQCVLWPQLKFWKRNIHVFLFS